MAANEWKLDTGEILYLLTPEQFKLLPDGTTLLSINYNVGIKGLDKIDQDTRYGYLAWGLLKGPYDMFIDMVKNKLLGPVEQTTEEARTPRFKQVAEEL